MKDKVGSEGIHFPSYNIIPMYLNASSNSVKTFMIVAASAAHIQAPVAVVKEYKWTRSCMKRITVQELLVCVSFGVCVCACVCVCVHT